MKGTRPLDHDEILSVSKCFTGTFQVRNRGLLMFGVSTGGRISELLRLQIKDVYQNSAAVTDLLHNKSIVKGGEVSPACQPRQQTIENVIGWHWDRYDNTAANRPLFPYTGIRNFQGQSYL